MHVKILNTHVRTYTSPTQYLTSLSHSNLSYPIWLGYVLNSHPVYTYNVLRKNTYIRLYTLHAQYFLWFSGCPPPRKPRSRSSTQNRHGRTDGRTDEAREKATTPASERVCEGARDWLLLEVLTYRCALARSLVLVHLSSSLLRVRVCSLACLCLHAHFFGCFSSVCCDLLKKSWFIFGRGDPVCSWLLLLGFFLIAFESCVTYPPGSGLRRYC
jgi:hypothetical protein